MRYMHLLYRGCRLKNCGRSEAKMYKSIFGLLGSCDSYSELRLEHVLESIEDDLGYWSGQMSE